MKQVGVRELNQNASAIVARVAAGESVIVTYRGRAVAQLSPIREGNLASLIAAGGARLPKRSLSELTDPPKRQSPEEPLSLVLDSFRKAERY
ncbi:MAG: type II toxin-antitoxin system prevent-host-death family antitoxin [Acidimicrobiaceae bacterium]|nr:type II toxin-antitoxin system prevent-host-death family antitoxin [Acidimicrobiaceae bacterium]